MPHINLKTNIEVNGDTIRELNKIFGKDIEIIPGKTERWLMTSIMDKVPMCFGGNDTPCALAEVSLFGSTSSDVYKNLTSELCRDISTLLNIPQDRIYIKYVEISEWGWNGSNF